MTDDSPKPAAPGIPLWIAAGIVQEALARYVSHLWSKGWRADDFAEVRSAVVRWQHNRVLPGDHAMLVRLLRVMEGADADHCDRIGSTVLADLQNRAAGGDGLAHY